MITGSNVDEISRQLEEFSKEVERKMKHMVESFAVDVVTVGVDNTPRGNAELYADLYALREGTMLPEEEGVAQGAWTVDLNGQLQFVVSSGPDSGLDAIANANMDMQAYQLGQSFVIGNAAPYIGDLENNYSDQTNGQGIVKPTLNQVMTAHEADLKRYYEAG